MCQVWYADTPDGDLPRSRYGHPYIRDPEGQAVEMAGNFKIINRDHFPLPSTLRRFYHLATITYGFREFMYFIDNENMKTYIEECTGGHLEQIKDDSLWEALAKFLQETGIATIRARR